MRPSEKKDKEKVSCKSTLCIQGRNGHGGHGSRLVGGDQLHSNILLMYRVINSPIQVFVAQSCVALGAFVKVKKKETAFWHLLDGGNEAVNAPPVWRIGSCKWN